MGETWVWRNELGSISSNGSINSATWRLLLAQTIFAAPTENCVFGMHVLITAVVSVTEAMIVTSVELWGAKEEKRLLLLPKNGLKAPKKRLCWGGGNWFKLASFGRKRLADRDWTESSVSQSWSLLAPSSSNWNASSDTWKLWDQNISTGLYPNICKFVDTKGDGFKESKGKSSKEYGQG